MHGHAPAQHRPMVCWYSGKGFKYTYILYLERIMLYCLIEHLQLITTRATILYYMDHTYLMMYVCIVDTEGPLY